MPKKAIEWIVCPYWQESRDVTLWVDVLKVDRSWVKDEAYYITAGGGGAAISGRYARAGEHIRGGVPLWMGALCLGDEDEIGFTDGRHRFAWLRDHGVEALPVQVPPEEAAAIKARFGTRRRVSSLSVGRLRKDI